MLILALIVYDTMIQCTYHYEQAWTWYLLQSVTDIVILTILTCEIIIKLIVYGIRRYFKTVSCSTEFVLTTISYLGLLSYIPHLRFFILFRCFRILRLFRILKFSSKVKLIMKSVWLSFGIFFNITVVLCILFFIYAVIGVFLFYDLPTEISNTAQINRYCNFSSFHNAIIALFRVSTNDWDAFQAEVQKYYPVTSIIYFFSFAFLVILILLNLVVGLLYENLTFFIIFTHKIFSLHDLDKFREAWLVYDRHGTKYIKESHLVNLLSDIPEPLGMKGRSKKSIEKMIKRLEIPVSDRGLVYFPDLLLVLCENVHDAEGSTEEIQDLVYNFWKSSFQGQDNIIKGRRRVVDSSRDLTLSSSQLPSSSSSYNFSSPTQRVTL